MRRTRIYHQEKLTPNQTVILSTETSHYLLHVLRKKIGDVFWLFDGSGAEYQAQLIAIEKKHAKVELGEVIFPDVESKLNVHLGQAISRGDRMDYAIQKAVEMGVAQITPLLTDFCQVKLPATRFEKKVAHWQAIAISAAEQSGRCVVPKINQPQKLGDWVTQSKADIKCICCPRINVQESHFIKDQEFETAVVAVGPEGGFSDAEVSNALKNYFQPLPLGPRVLRTETAAVVALTVLQTKFGDLVA